MTYRVQVGTSLKEIEKEEIERRVRHLSRPTIPDTYLSLVYKLRHGKTQQEGKCPAGAERKSVG